MGYTITLVCLGVVTRLDSDITGYVNNSVPVLLHTREVLKTDEGLSVVFGTGNIMGTICRAGGVFSFILGLLANRGGVDVILHRTTGARGAIGYAKGLIPIGGTRFTRSGQRVLVKVRLHFVGRRTTKTIRQLGYVVLVIGGNNVRVFLVVVPIATTLPGHSIGGRQNLGFVVTYLTIGFTPVVGGHIFRRRTLQRRRQRAKTFLRGHRRPGFLTRLSIVALLNFFGRYGIFLGR